MQVGELIRQKRKEKKLTLKQLAKEIDLSYTYLSQIELGDRNASPEILERISQHLDISFSELMEVAGYSEKKNVLQKALDAQLQLIENIRELKGRINEDIKEPEWKSLTYEEKVLEPFDVQKNRIFRRYLSTMEGILNELNNQINNYSNPQKDKEEIEFTLKMMLEDINKYLTMQKSSLAPINMEEALSPLDEIDKMDLIAFIDEYLSQENDPYLSDFEEYSKQKGINLYKTLNKEQLNRIFKVLVDVRNLRHKILENKDYVDNSVETQNKSISTEEAKQIQHSLESFVGKVDNIVELENIFNMAQEITINGRTLSQEDKEKALQILKLTFDK